MPRSILTPIGFSIATLLFARDWTVLVYMAADNSLSAWADSDLIEMERVGSDDNLAIIVQVDKPQIGARRLYVAFNQLQNLGELGIIDMCDWHTLKDFLVWGVSNYPARNYIAILWDHATGWTLSDGRSFGSDWSSGNQMGVANGELQEAFRSFYNATGKKLDILAFDACLMQEIEVAYEMRDYAKIQIAPQTIWPLSGFPYTEILSIIKKRPNINEIEMAREIVEICTNHYYGIQSVAISAVNLENLTELKGKMNKAFNKIMANSSHEEIKDLRNRVQTISPLNPSPQITDDYVDLGDFLKLLNEYLLYNETEELYEQYQETIIAHGVWGEVFEKTTGLTTWFPDRYIEFKQLIELYLLLDYHKSNWPNFLNWFYGEDDIRPKDVYITSGMVGSENDFRLFWTSSFDLAPVSYCVIECSDTNKIFYDPAEDSSDWILSGFTISSNEAHSGNSALFSGNYSNLNNYARTRGNINLTDYGVLDLYLNYLTEDMVDSFIIEYGDNSEVYYGNSRGWINCRILLPPGDYPLRFCYRTNATVNCGGVYIDDIKVYRLLNSRFIRRDITDTTILIYNILRGDYLFATLATDSYGNSSNLSNLTAVSVNNYAVPYCNPNPFITDCEIILDYPDTLRPVVYIYSISGRLIKRFSYAEFGPGKRIYWKGLDEKNQQVGSGLYFVFVKDGPFNKVGKIVCER